MMIGIMKKGSALQKDLSGLSYGFLKVLKFSFVKNRRSHWECLCSCGNIKVFSRKYIIENSFPSCGCFSKISEGNSILRNFDECVKYKMDCILNNSKWIGKCLIWQGSVNLKSIPYARTSFLNQCFYIKDLIWFFKNRISLGKNLKILPTCENPKCINIDHLGVQYDARSNNKSINRLFEISKDRREQKIIR